MGRREKPLDPDAGPVQRFAHDLRLLREKAGTPPYREVARRAGYSVTAVSQAAAGAQLPSLAVVRAYAEALDSDPEEWERRWREADAETRVPAPDERAPYRGLVRFETGDDDLYFGRGELVAETLEMVRAHRFAAVFGPSGSGKSSLLRAGLIPRLREEEGALRPAVVRVLTPGEHPARTHAQAFIPRPGDGDTWVIVDQFEEVFTLCADRAERDRFLDLLLTSRAPDSGLRVVVAVRGDFYGHCAGHRELADAVRRANLLVGPMSRDELREVVTGPAAVQGLTVERALTARVLDEALDRPGALPMLSHALLETWRRRKGRLLSLAAYEETGGVSGAIATTAEHAYGALTPAQARTARRVLLRLIAPGDDTPDTRRPAARDDVTGAADVLEHLAAARLITLDGDTVELAHEALITAWPRLAGWIDDSRDRLRAHRHLDEASRTWADLGRDPGALYRGVRLAAAEELFGRAEEPARPTTAEGLLRRIAIGAPSRAAEQPPGNPAEPPLPSGNPAEPSPTSDSPVEPASAAPAELASAIPVELASAAPAEPASPIPAEPASATPAEPASSAKPPLPSDRASTGPLSADLTPLERDFLTASTTARTAEARAARRTRNLAVGLAVVLVLALGAGLLAWQRDRAGDAEAAKASARRLAGMADSLRSTDPRTAALLGVAAWKVAPLDESRAALLKAYAQAEQSAFTDPRTGADVRRYLVDGGRTLLSVDGTRVVALDTARQRVTATYTLPAGTEALGPGPGGRYLDVIRADGTERLWDLVKDSAVADLAGSTLQDSASDGSAYLTGPADGPGTAVLRRTSDGKTLLGVPTPGTLTGAAVGPGGKLAAFCPADGAPQVWADGKKIAGEWDKADKSTCGTGSGADGGVRMLLISADGTRLAAVHGTTVTVWDTRGTLVADFSGPAEAGFTQAALSPDGRFLVTSDDTELTVWRLATGGTVAYSAPLTGARPAGLTWDPSTPRTLRYLDGATVHTLDLADRLDTPWQDTPAGAEALSPDGATLATVTGTRLDLRSTRTGKSLAHATLTPTATPLLAFSPDGTALAVADGTGVTVWDVRAGSPRATFPGTPPTALALGPGGRTLVTVGETTQLWDTRTRRRSTLTGFTSTRAAFRPDGALIVGSDDQYADPRTGTTTGRALADGRQVTALAFDPDGTRLAVGDTTGRITLWDGDLKHRAGVLTADAKIDALAFDGDTLAAGTATGTLGLWDTRAGRPIATLPTPGDEIHALAFTQDALYASAPHVPLQRLPLAPAQAVRAVCARAGGGLSEALWREYVPDAPYRELCPE